MQTLVAAVIDNDGSNDGSNNGNHNDGDSVNIESRTMRWVLEQ